MQMDDFNHHLLPSDTVTLLCVLMKKSSDILDKVNKETCQDVQLGADTMEVKGFPNSFLYLN